MAFFLGLMTLVSTLVVPGTWPHTRRCPSPRASESTPAEQAQKAESLKAALSAAIQREQYTDAAALRDELASLTLDDEVSVLQANTAFYDAFSSGDFDAMEALWSEDVVCAHPGFPHLRGHAEVMDSWSQIFDQEALDMIVSPDNVRCTLLRGGLSAVVTCAERVGEDRDNAMTATNIFEKDADGRWRMVLHQAGPQVVKASS